MKITSKIIAPVLTSLLSTSVLAVNTAESTMDRGFEKLEQNVPGKFSIDARLRYEHFDLDAPGGLLP